MHELLQFEDSSVDVVYASHVLEHAHYGAVGPSGGEAGSVTDALKEWARVLKDDVGILMVSVPDLTILTSLYANGGLDAAEKFHLMRMIFGGQTDSKDAHLAGFDEDILTEFLSLAGFCRVRRVANFNLIAGVDWVDTSSMQWHNNDISVNVVANKCK